MAIERKVQYYIRVTDEWKNTIMCVFRLTEMLYKPNISIDLELPRHFVSQTTN